MKILIESQQVIWKYKLSLAGRTFLQVRERATILDCQIQGPDILDCQTQGPGVVLWIHQDLSLPIVERSFFFLPTGNCGVNFLGEYIRTIQLPDATVWHLFEVIEG